MWLDAHDVVEVHENLASGTLRLCFEDDLQQATSPSLYSTTSCHMHSSTLLLGITRLFCRKHVHTRLEIT